MSTERHVNRTLKLIGQLSIDKASQVLSKTIKAGARIVLEEIHIEDISVITENIIADHQDEVVGTFIDLEGEAPFKFLFFVDAKDSMVLADMMLRREIGTTKEFDLYAQSAVQEIGNILASAISNVFASDFQVSMKPSPPIVVHDFAGTIFEQYIISVALDQNDVLVMESMFQTVVQGIKARMFILPMADTVDTLTFVTNSM